MPPSTPYDRFFEQLAEQHDRLASIAPELEAIFQKQGLPKPFLPQRNRMSTFRKLASASATRFLKSPFVRETLASLPNADIETQDKSITVRDGSAITLRIRRVRQSLRIGQPLVVVAHGGGWCLGDLDTEAFLCELLCRSLKVIVVDVGYRLTPEVDHKDCLFDVYDAVKWVASNASTFGGDLSKGFTTTGVSGGGNLTNAVTYLARDNKLHPPLTGTLLQCTGMVHQHTDSQGRSLNMYRDKLVSWDRLEDAPIVSRGTVKVYGDLANLDVDSRLISPFLEKDHSKLPPLYYQVCGMDPWRDSGIFYTHLLSEAGVPTKLDLYPGLPHCWWSAYPQISTSRKWANDTVEGVRWLLREGASPQAAPKL